MRSIIFVLVAGLLGGCVVVPAEYGYWDGPRVYREDVYIYRDGPRHRHKHHYWGDRRDGDPGYWRYRGN
jgi:hypothetical protein